MTTYLETQTDAWKRRAAIAGAVDFSMMYLGHDAFSRDLDRLVTAADAGDGLGPAALATWRTFSTQLRSHHTAEDRALWPMLRTAVTAPAELQILDDMEAEHAAIEPRLEQVEAAIRDQDADALASGLTGLATGLAVHLVHEENEALPLLERRLGQAGWDAFGKAVRDESGLSGAAEFLPWALDGASEHAAQKLLGLLPAPARLLYRRSWEPAYRRSVRLH
jgi:iron-sulfur cluster repair protein YtfE (RIC family)